MLCRSVGKPGRRVHKGEDHPPSRPGRIHVAAIAVGRQLKPAPAGAGPGTAKPAEHREVPFAGSPLTAELPEGDFALLAATSVAG